jgi:hypothetical protein
MRRVDIRDWLPTLFVFLMILCLGSLRKLHAAGLPILEIVIDAFGAATLFALFSYFFGRRSPN